MKRMINSLLAIAVCAALSSCSKEAGGPEYGEIAFSIDRSGATRASDTETQTEECVIHNLQILVFDEDGNRDTYMDMGDRTEGLIKVRTGNKKVFALANGPSLAECGTEEEMNSVAIGLGQWNGGEKGFIMSGSGRCTVTGESVTRCPVAISRYVSRVVLRSITNKLPETYGYFTINRIMLTNAVASQNIGGDASETEWENRMGLYDASESSACTVLNAEMKLSSGFRQTIPIRLYCYPNSTTADRFAPDASFTPRYTRMVICAVVGGKKCYYPISLPDLERNTTYDVSVTVWHAGSDNPEEPVSPAYISVNVTAGEWHTGPDIVENL